MVRPRATSGSTTRVSGIPTSAWHVRYWASRAQAAAWAAVYSVQFEFGPLSEASIGNVGMRAETTGWVDHAATPAGAFALMVGEDALDRFFVRWVEVAHAESVLSRGAADDVQSVEDLLECRDRAPAVVSRGSPYLVVRNSQLPIPNPQKVGSW